MSSINNLGEQALSGASSHGRLQATETLPATHGAADRGIMFPALSRRTKSRAGGRSGVFERAEGGRRAGGERLRWLWGEGWFVVVGRVEN